MTRWPDPTISNPKNLKISVITAVYNRQATIQSAIDSVCSQELADLEYIVIDGMSDDGTEEIVRDNASKISVSIREPDAGIYDALNKGIRAASGDVVGFLHADDIFNDQYAVGYIQKKFQENEFDAVYGDLLYVDAVNTDKVIRYWKSGEFKASRFRHGWMPPHPTVYIKKSIYDKYGLYRTDLGSAADYECLVRMMVKHQLRVGYVPQIIVKMRVGGASNASLISRMIANRLDLQAWLENGLQPPFGLRITKPLSKLPQFFRRPTEKAN